MVIDLTDKNLFSYCDYNPVMRTDDDGQFWHIIIGAAIGAAISFGYLMLAKHKSIKDLNVWDICASAASGVLAASGFGYVGLFTGFISLIFFSYYKIKYK